MSINIETDELIPLGILATQRLGKRPSPATLWRWRLHGVNGARLAVVKSGGCWMTTAAAFAEFLRAQTANCSPAPLADDAPAERSAATQKKLAAAGLL
ncbi:MAG: DUF1580 domain-containing protein [Planctomycetia bacterium]|nr:DUF1580 domain-containing protein [Planctomycetia bacterium]